MQFDKGTVSVAVHEATIIVTAQSEAGEQITVPLSNAAATTLRDALTAVL